MKTFNSLKQILSYYFPKKYKEENKKQLSPKKLGKCLALKFMKKYLIFISILLVFGCGTIRYRLEHHDGKLEHKTQWDILEFDFNRLYKKDTRQEDFKRIQNDIDVLKNMLLELKEKYESDNKNDYNKLKTNLY